MSTDPNEPNEMIKLRRFEEVRQWLVAFYRKHNPEALGTVDETLRQWAGQENEFFMQLVVKCVSFFFFLPSGCACQTQYVYTTLGKKDLRWCIHFKRLKVRGQRHFDKAERR